MHRRRGIPDMKTERWRSRACDLDKRAKQLETGVDRLIAQATAELAARGVSTAGLLDMQILAMLRDERRKASALAHPRPKIPPNQGTTVPTGTTP